MAADGDLAWAAEEACLNAWPSARQLVLDGWLVRVAGGPTRRANSVNPLRGGPRDPGPVIDACERIYAARGRPAIFRVPDIAPGMDAPLARRGYAREEDVRTLHRDLRDADARADPAVRLAPRPTRDWHAARSRLTGATRETVRTFRDTTACLVIPAAFASLTVEGEVACVAYGAVDRALLAIEAVVTDPGRRGAGLARRTVSELIRWGRAQGAAGACLQVAAANAPACALYARLGFGREVYRYHYRRRDPVGG